MPRIRTKGLTFISDGSRKITDKAPRDPREQKLQGAIILYFATVVPAGSAILFAVPNGEYRDKRTAELLSGPTKDPLLPDDAYLVPAGQGVVSGAPDLILLSAAGVTTLIEVKVPKEGEKRAGVLSKVQRIFHAAAALLGHEIKVIRTVDEFDSLLRAKGVPVLAVLIPQAFGLSAQIKP